MGPHQAFRSHWELESDLHLARERRQGEPSLSSRKAVRGRNQKPEEEEAAREVRDKGREEDGFRELREGPPLEASSTPSVQVPDRNQGGSCGKNNSLGAQRAQVSVPHDP